MNFDVTILLNAVPDGRVFGLDQQTLISTGIHLLNACILAVALGFILYKPVQEFMRKRSERISGQLDEARNKMVEADALKAGYEKKLREIDAERVKILEAARLTASEKSRRIIDLARSEAADIKQRAEQSAMSERERLKEETRLYIIEASSLMAGKFVEKTIDSDTQDRLFDEAIAELEESAWLS
ncbi:MAG: hypothetical protein ACOYJD_04355 [Christensenellales bacterium]